MSEEQKHYPWMEGMPTKPDVDALFKAFPPDSLTVGRRISDDEVMAVVGSAAGNRYRTIYSVWVRRLQRDHGINLFRENTVGFFVPTPDEVAARTHPTLQHMGRTAKKQMRNLAAVKATNEMERATVDHQGRLLHSIARETKKARMNVLPSTAAPQQVRLPPAGRAAEEP